MTELEIELAYWDNEYLQEVPSGCNSAEDHHKVWLAGVKKIEEKPH